jgi:hypothetical protein
MIPLDEVVGARLPRVPGHGIRVAGDFMTGNVSASVWKPTPTCFSPTVVADGLIGDCLASVRKRTPTARLTPIA